MEYLSNWDFKEIIAIEGKHYLLRVDITEVG